MIAYLTLISVTFLSPIVMRSIVKDTKKAETYALGISALLLFLVFALRAPSVGRDIPGYKEMYEKLAANLKYDANTYWTEKGYELLEIFFGRYLKADWQVFLAFCSGFSIFSYFLFIKRYSLDPTFSLLIYIFMGYMIFDISAVRTMLSIAICLLVLPFFDKKGIWPAMAVTFAVILVATQIHSSAYIFFFLYILYKIPINSISIFFFVSLPVFFFALRGPIMDWAISNFKRSEVDGGLSLGGNVILYALFLLFAIIVFFVSCRQRGISMKSIGGVNLAAAQKTQIRDALSNIDIPTMMSFRMLYAGALFTIFAGSNIFSRMAQYGLIFTITLLPNLTSKLEAKSRFIVKLGLLGLLAVYFYFLKVRTNELDFLPYKFFWQA